MKFLLKFDLQQNETALEIAHRKNLRDITQIVQHFDQYLNGHKRPQQQLHNTSGGNLNGFPEKSVDDTTEDDFDVDAIVLDPTYDPNNPKAGNNNNNHNMFKTSGGKGLHNISSGSSKENHKSGSNRRSSHQYNGHAKSGGAGMKPGSSGRKKRSSHHRSRMTEDDIFEAMEAAEDISWSPYGYHPQLAELDDLFHRNPRAVKDIMDQLNPGEQFYLDLAGNIRKGPVTKTRNCYCAPVFAKFEKKLEKDKRDLIRVIDQSQNKLDNKIAYLEKKTKEQLFGLNQAMKESFAAERGECLDRMDRRALRERIAIERQQV